MYMYTQLLINTNNITYYSLLYWIYWFCIYVSRCQKWYTYRYSLSISVKLPFITQIVYYSNVLG